MHGSQAPDMRVESWHHLVFEISAAKVRVRPQPPALRHDVRACLGDRGRYGKTKQKGKRQNKTHHHLVVWIPSSIPHAHVYTRVRTCMHACVQVLSYSKQGVRAVCGALDQLVVFRAADMKEEFPQARVYVVCIPACMHACTPR